MVALLNLALITNDDGVGRPCCMFYLCSIFNKLIDDQGHLDMRNVTTLIWVNRIRPEIVETIVELLIEVSCLQLCILSGIRRLDHFGSPCQTNEHCCTLVLVER